MRVLFLRHADAEVLRTTDEARPLTSKGNRQARIVGEFLASSGLRPSMILTSPLVRARETAGVVTAVAGLPDPEVAGWLACGMTPARCYAECGKLAADAGDILLVGHEPDFGEVIGEWIGGGGAMASVRVRKASLTGLNVCAFAPGGAGLEFLLPVKLISHAP